MHAGHAGGPRLARLRMPFYFTLARSRKLPGWVGSSPANSGVPISVSPFWWFIQMFTGGRAVGRVVACRVFERRFDEHPGAVRTLHGQTAVVEPVERIDDRTGLEAGGANDLLHGACIEGERGDDTEAFGFGEQADELTGAGHGSPR